jgi:hypothetical protein
MIQKLHILRPVQLFLAWTWNAILNFSSPQYNNSSFFKAHLELPKKQYKNIGGIILIAIYGVNMSANA